MSTTTTLTSVAILASSQSSSTVQSAGNSNDKQPAPRAPSHYRQPYYRLSPVSSYSVLSSQLANFPLITLYLNTFIYFLLALSSIIGFYVFFPRPTDQKTPKVKRLQFLASTYATLFVLSGPIQMHRQAALVLSPTASVALELGVGRSTSFKAGGVTLIVLGWLASLAITISVNMYTSRVQKLLEDDFERNLGFGDDSFDWRY
ncbi:hypothetical protein F5887DRAFT_1283036 [Amanita rubescens]|nr:hypothetical protein F5887DRAFT_1283036 [Amanita rubescens]